MRAAATLLLAAADLRGGRRPEALARLRVLRGHDVRFGEATRAFEAAVAEDHDPAPAVDRVREALGAADRSLEFVTAAVADALARRRRPRRGAGWRRRGRCRRGERLRRSRPPRPRALDTTRRWRRYRGAGRPPACGTCGEQPRSPPTLRRGRTTRTRATSSASSSSSTSSTSSTARSSRSSPSASRPTSASTDAQIGFLYGTAFAVFYALFGIPLGRLADVWDRRRLIALGLAVLERDDGALGARAQLRAARARRASASASARRARRPAAFSLLSDYFPPRAARDRARDLLERHLHRRRASASSSAG